MPDEYRIIGVGRSALSNEDFRSLVHEKLLTFSPGIVLDEFSFKAFCSRFFYVKLDFKEGDSYQDLYKEVMAVSHEASLCEHILYYLATPPDLAPVIIRNLDQAGLGGKKESCGGWLRNT